MPEKKKTGTPRPGPEEPLLADRKAREQIARVLDTTFLVEAGAGSGKTQSLVERMIAILASGYAPIQTLTAVTFTRKAAAELRERFQVALERARATERDPDRKRRLDESLGKLEQAFIGTIHSFSARLLRERPVEAGVDPEFEELEELEDGVFRDKCWQDFLVEARLGDESRLRGLEDVGLLPHDLTGAFAKLAFFPDVEPAPGGALPPDYDLIRKDLESFLGDAAEAVPKERPSGGFDDIQILVLRLERRSKNLGFDSHLVLMETIELFDKNLSVTQNRWPSKEDALVMQKMLDAFKEDIAIPALRSWREYRHGKILEFLKPALAYYEERRIAKSLFNYEDLLLLASRLLRENPGVRRYFRKRFHPILVDEFQDTDPIQAEILFFLAGIDCDERDWTKIRPRPGSLFLVGDPKQSIYRFRRADIDIYNFVKNRIGDSGGIVCELTANFRSLQSIAGWINPVFEASFPEKTDGYQASFAPLVTVREHCPEAPCGIYQIPLRTVKRNKEALIVEEDAVGIAAYIGKALKENLKISTAASESRTVQPSDFLILFRYRKNMSAYARALENLGIPYEIVGGSGLAESAEIGAVIRIMRAIGDPDNPVTAIAALKSLFFGLSDQELLEFRERGGEFSLASEISPDGSPCQKADGALFTLKKWQALTMKFPPSTVLELILEESGLVYYLASSEMGSSRAGNVLKLVDIVRRQEEKGMTSFISLARFLEEWIDELDAEEMSLTPGRRNAVRLMNLHKAKGLEASVVFLANPVGLSDRSPETHVVRLKRSGEGIERRKPEGYFLFTRKSGYRSKILSQPVGWESMAEEEMKYARAEENRLMYVAATRARDLLIISTYERDLGARRAWSVLDDSLEGIAELERPSGRSAGPRKPGVFRSPPGTVRKGRQSIRKARGEAARAGYYLENVTSLAKEEQTFPGWFGGGMGMSWGTAVHSVLRALGKAWPVRGGHDGRIPVSDKELGMMARNALVAAGRDVGEGEKLVELARAIIASEFWGRAMRSLRRLFEVPFSIRVDDDAPEYGDLVRRQEEMPAIAGRPSAAVKRAPLIINGAIDLAFHEKGGWVIADYKTDGIADIATAQGVERAKRALDSLVDYYRPQVALYSRYWARITGERIKESGLYFTSLRVWHRIP